MLVFIIPLKSKATSQSWAKVSKLFEKCVQSACRQTHPDFHVIVVCHDRPDITFKHSRLSYIEANFPTPDIDSGTKTDVLNRRKYLESLRTDKGRKLLAGLVAAQKFHPSHTMLLDADDLVSNRLAELVHQNPQANGWVFRSGYLYTHGRNWIYRKPRNFYKMCGSCNIIRNDLNDIPDKPGYSRGQGYYRFYLDHQKVASTLEDKGYPLAPAPFPGAVYIVETGENIYFSSSRLYQGISRYINYRWVGSDLKNEFNI
jgi:hypothetical protein